VRSGSSGGSLECYFDILIASGKGHGVDGGDDLFAIEPLECLPFLPAGW
jgi:hypothetical protein